MALAATVVVVAAVLAIELTRTTLVHSLTGVVLTANTDPAKQIPIANAEITAAGRTGVASARSDAKGLFRIALPRGLFRGEAITLSFDREGYRPLIEMRRIFHQDYVVWLTPVGPAAVPVAIQPQTLSDLRVRYITRGATTTEIGSMVRTFQVVNKANIPCDGQSLCSPDGRWRASLGGLKLDAGEGQEYRNARVSCIAGPCPFTRIEKDEFSPGGRVISVTVRDWSDTTTFLLEAEVVRTVASELIRQLYPALFGRIISFTLPASAQGPSFEVDLNGEEITFPLGPDLLLSWAHCTLTMEPNRTRLYSCELKPGYRVH